MTNEQNPDNIIEELVRVVSSKHLLYERKGFLIRIRVCDDWGRVKLAFDLEVVQLKTKQLGIRRKRVKGDTWHYKRYCEDVIRSSNVGCSASSSTLNIQAAAGMANSGISPPNYSYSSNNSSSSTQRFLAPQLST